MHLKQTIQSPQGHTLSTIGVLASHLAAFINNAKRNTIPSEHEIQIATDAVRESGWPVDEIVS